MYELSHQALDLAAKGSCGIGVPHNNHNRIITGKGSQNNTHIHSIQSRSRSIGQSGKGMNHNNILGIVKIGHAFTENGIQTAGKAAGNFTGRSGVTVGTKVVSSFTIRSSLISREMVA